MQKIRILSGFIVVLSLFNPAYAIEYQSKTAASGTIHTVKIVKGWCGNLGVSTKVGHIENGVCRYEKETVPYGYDNCTLNLNGGLLEGKVGPGYQCGATQIHSGFNGSHAIDEFRFVLDNEGHYIGTQPAYSEVELKD